MKLTEPQKKLLLQIANTGKVYATQGRTYDALDNRGLVRNKKPNDPPAPQVNGFDSFALTEAGRKLLEQISAEEQQATA